MEHVLSARTHLLRNKLTNSSNLIDNNLRIADISTIPRTLLPICRRYYRWFFFADLPEFQPDPSLDQISGKRQSLRCRKCSDCDQNFREQDLQFPAVETKRTTAQGQHLKWNPEHFAAKISAVTSGKISNLSNEQRDEASMTYSKNAKLTFRSGSQKMRVTIIVQVMNLRYGTAILHE